MLIISKSTSLFTNENRCLDIYTARYFLSRYNIVEENDYRTFVRPSSIEMLTPLRFITTILWILGVDEHTLRSFQFSTWDIAKHRYASVPTLHRGTIQATHMTFQSANSTLPVSAAGAKL